MLDNLISDMSFEKSTADAKARIKLFKEKYPGVILKIIQKGEVVDG